ncbi:MAG: hypothetical protein J5641_04465 [Bacteroidales bacterium]|nr:hypothetical protein [Bacteroidales bacterium]
MKKILLPTLLLLILAVSCEKADVIQPITPPEPPDTDTIVPDQPVPAIFSVSDSLKVRFAPGNLQHIDGTWQFAAHQGDFLGTFDANHCDLFTWSTTNTNWGLDTMWEWMYYDYDFRDWGSNPDLIATLGEGWRTLSADEWDYLLNHRVVNGSAGEGHSWIAARIDGQYGLIIYPDNFTQQTSTLGIIPDSCVFLPAPGSRDGNTLLFRNEDFGFYWTSTPTEGLGEANHLIFYQSYSQTMLRIGTTERYLGLSVRLARDI